MKKLNLLTAAILLPFITFAQKNTANMFKVQVHLRSASKKTKLYLAYQAYGKKIIDSATLQNGVYVLNGLADRPLNATLIADTSDFGVSALIKKTKEGFNVDALRFYIYPGIINIKTNSLIAGAIFHRSSINADNDRLKAMMKNIDDQTLHISNLLRAGHFVRKGNEDVPAKTPSPEEIYMVQRLTKQLDSLKIAKRPILKEFIKANPNSYIALVALEDYAGNSPAMQEIESMYMRLRAGVRNTIAGRAFGKFLFDIKNLVPGTIAPQFTQNDTAGNAVSLSAFRGKYVLLDFWASWCGPCRLNNPELVRIFQDFGSRNFTIFAISLDAADGRDSWLKAIRDDHLTWMQVSDLKHWDNQVAKLYGVRSIPQNFLIDPEGIIIAKGLDMNGLRKKLVEILPK